MTTRAKIRPTRGAILDEINSIRHRLAAVMDAASYIQLASELGAADVGQWLAVSERLYAADTALEHAANRLMPERVA